MAESVDAGSVEALRSRVAEVGRSCGLADVELTKFVLVVHELVVNAVRHGGGRAEVAVWTDPAGLRCSVTDQGHGIPRRHLDFRRAAPDDQIRPWGLRLVHMISRDVQVDTGGRGTRVEISYPTGDRR